MQEETTAIADDLQVEAVTIVSELVARDERLSSALRSLCPQAELRQLPDDEFNGLNGEARAIVRTGARMQEYSVILRSGANF
jgi:D-ribose pyranose/furanose isomerase RbsD